MIGRTPLALLAAAALALAGCGEDEGEPAAESAAETSTTTSTTASTTPSTATETQATGTGEGEDGGSAQSDPPAGGPGAGAPAASAELAIRAVLTDAGDATEACTDFVTDDFVATAYGGRANCIAARRPNALAASVRISEGDGGTFVVVPRGGPYDGVEVEVEVVEDGGFRVASLLADIPAGP